MKRMNGFIRELNDIYRLEVPFENIYTSVFLVRSPSGVIIVDCATTNEDVDGYIIPALGAMGYGPSDIDTLVLTHKHSDHAGGLLQLLSLAPDIKVVRDVREIFDGIYTYPMAGHTEDCIGLLDTRSHTLIAGDGLQGAGVDKYRCYTQDPKAYIRTIERIRNDSRIENILFSHAYEPWNSDALFGRKKVINCIRDCKKYVRR